MNRYSFGFAGKAAVAASVLALLLPGVAHATDHMLSLVAGTSGNFSWSTTTPVTMTHAGGVSSPLVISITESQGNNTTTTQVTLGSGQTLSTTTINVKMCAIGTGGQLEWLDQGPTVVGVTGALTSADGNYHLTLTMDPNPPSPTAVSGSCSPQGAKNYTYTSGGTAALRRGNSNNFDSLFTSIYKFWNATNAVPEPGTIALMLSALFGLGWISRRRARRAAV